MQFSSLFRKKHLQSLQEQSHASTMHKTLSVWDLAAFGIAAIIGAGIFATIGNAAANGGPAISLLFIFTGVACGFSALCYAQFASSVPTSGSAYTYAYVSFGEIIAWIIGWDLLLEYAIGNIAVAISWSDYFTGFLQGFGWDMPSYLTMDFLSAWRGFQEASTSLASGQSLEALSDGLQQAYHAWENAPVVAGMHMIFDLPALVIVVLITYLVYIGIRESRTASNLLVGLKLIVIITVVLIGAFYIKPSNWSPFAPNGFGGVMKGVAAVFFAYIGFDAISTTTEECKNPKRDLPRAIFAALIICTVLYILVALTLTGMVPFSELAVGDPLAYVFKQVGLDWISGIVAFSALIAMASVLLVFQMGQPRIWMSMSRDGLLPSRFAKIHPKFKTPSFATLITGILVAVPALFMNLQEVTDLTSIGTLFAFVIVCAGVLLVPPPEDGFKVPYYNGRYLLPVILLVIFFVMRGDGQGWHDFWHPQEGSFLSWDIFKHKIPYLIFALIGLLLTALTIWKQLSIIPVLGLLSCLYLMSELGYTNWLRFLIWLVIGLTIYGLYSYRHSKWNPVS